MDVEWIILADAAEVLNNKLYMLGGGWETVTINSLLPAVHPCAVVLSFKVPWNETNQRHNIEVELADQDGNQILKVEGQVEVGRPPGIPLGHAQRVQMAISMGLNIQNFGPHVIVARIEGQEVKRISFEILAGPALATSRSAIGPAH